MGWFSSSPPSESKRAEEVRTGARAPDRRERAKCWEARDAYFTCLDGAGVIDAIKEDKTARKSCPSETEAFEKDCATAWVKYFKQWRVADIQKKARIAQLEKEGAVKMDVATTFGGTGGGEAGSGAGAGSSATSGVPKGTSKEDIQEMLARRQK